MAPMNKDMARKALDRMYTSKSIAEWNFAEELLNLHDGDETKAIENLEALVGHGVNSSDSEHIAYLIKRVAFEAAELAAKGYRA